jgi:long-chain fatty acid transport protein
MKNILKIITVSSIVSSALLAGGAYSVPEQSVDSLARAGAYSANSSGANAAYYNPANLVFNEDSNQLEIGLTYINLTEVKYDDNRLATFDSKSKVENAFAPNLFFSSKDRNGLRYGLAIVSPNGSAKRWDDTFAKTFAEHFSIRTIEFNPVVSYLVNKNFSIGGGLRVVYTDGIVKSDGEVSPTLAPGVIAKRDLEGDAILYGYNLAFTYKPNENQTISATYRSNVNLDVKGSAKLYLNGVVAYDGSASVLVPAPAVLTLAYSQKIEKTTVEFNYNRTYWSKYKTLDFNYSSTTANPLLYAAFDAPIPKNYKDTNDYRLGLTYEYSDRLDLMAGFGISQSPSPESTLEFSLPDSDRKLYSVGFDYDLDDQSSFGMGYMYMDLDDRSIKNTNLDGTFSNQAAHFLSVAYKMSF